MNFYIHCLISHMIQSHTRYRCTALWVEMQFSGCDFRQKVGSTFKTFTNSHTHIHNIHERTHIAYAVDYELLWAVFCQSQLYTTVSRNL